VEDERRLEQLRRRLRAQRKAESEDADRERLEGT
jgi:hypothetical protein